MKYSKTKVSIPSLDLFPFLSVIVCTIGSLVLIIIMIVLQSEDSTVGAKKYYIECRCNQWKLVKNEYSSKKYSQQLSNSSTIVEDTSFSYFIKDIQLESDSVSIHIDVYPSGIEVFRKIRNQIIKMDIDFELDLIPEKKLSDPC